MFIITAVSMVDYFLRINFVFKNLVRYEQLINNLYFLKECFLDDYINC